jgi:hypothetical protein
MKRRVLIAVCAACAISCTAAASASAATVLDLASSEGTLAAGAQLSVLSGKVLQTPEGTVECPTSILVGTLTSNDASKDKVTITSGAYTGPNGVLCTTSTSLGPVEIAAGGLPWTQEFAKTGKAQLKGKKKLRLTVTVPALLSLQCTYEAPKLAETFTLAAGERPTPLLLTLADQDFVRSSGSGALCPGQISTGGAAVAVAAYGPGGALLPVSVTRRRSAG